MKKILGLDLGTNSIGWAVVNANIDENGKEILQGISAAGSRIIPMDAEKLGKFATGNKVSQTADRTSYRSNRRLRERHLLRRERLHRVLNIMGFLPEHFAKELDRYGKFASDKEPKIAWKKTENDSYEFLFKDSFERMLKEFQEKQPEFCADGKKIPYDWTIYYLRARAINEEITKEELAWLLLNFNQKRGYYQLRGEDEEKKENKKENLYSLKVIKVEEADKDRKGDEIWYNVILENGWIYKRKSKYPLDWVGKTKDFIVTEDLDENGNPKKDKDGNVKRSFRAPGEDDWTLQKKKTEQDIDQSKKLIGQYVYETLLSKPNQKINGKLIRTVERKYYKQELEKILDVQSQYIPELKNKNLLTQCLEALYAYNEEHRKMREEKGFKELFIDDIIFYQRPLKSKKSLISNCPYESNKYVDNETKELKTAPLKCIAKSHPLFQEFRLWQFIQNLRIYQKEKEVNGKMCSDVDVTYEFLKSEDDFVDLFDWLNDKKEIDEKAFLKYPKFGLKKNATDFRWNYVQNDKKYPCNETRSLILAKFAKINIGKEFLTKEKELLLWEILYSIEDKIEFKKALEKFATKQGLDKETFANEFSKTPSFPKEYGAYSAKAIKKLLPLMRMGKYWNEDDIDANTRNRIEKIITAEYDENIRNQVRDKAINLKEIDDFRGLPLWLACYIVYDRHSEGENVRWSSPADIDAYLRKFKQYSLRNPIVEQVVTETLRVVRDIWKQEKNIDEIHIEMGRDMKLPAEKRKAMTERNLENENTNLRIKALLMEFKNPEYEIENVRPYSPSQQDLLRIYEEYAVSNLDKNDKENYDFVSKISKTAQPSKSEILRYKCWLEQQYRSPYTGAMIPLSKLFTPAYEIEHIIPQSRFFDDSFNNKVICESAVNKRKDNQLGYEFIKNHHGEKIELGDGTTAEIFSIDAYEQFIKEHYSTNRRKMDILLREEIPDGFSQQQLNDSRYISKFIKNLLSNIVRDQDEDEAISKHVIPCNGKVTDRLKKDWGVNDVWNRIILPRFQRMNKLMNRSDFTSTNTSGNEIPAMPLEFQQGFNKKRIDHRHHAMDAIVIACANRNIVNYLNNISANGKTTRYDLQHLLCFKTKPDENGNYQWLIHKPWDSFTQDTYEKLNNIIVSFKQNLRVINKATNKYESYKDEKGNLRLDKNGKPQKAFIKQIKGDHWAIRKSMHKKTFYGEVNLQFKDKTVALPQAIKNPSKIIDKKFRKQLQALLTQKMSAKLIKAYFEENAKDWPNLNLSKIPVMYYTKETSDRYFATRFTNDLINVFKGINTKTKALDKISEITDTGIQKILINHLNKKNGNAELAFCADGIDEMNQNIAELNDNKPHQPIYTVRKFEKANKFTVGSIGNKNKKFVEADDGTNLFFAIYEDKKGKRIFESIQLKDAIENSKYSKNPVPLSDNDGNGLKFVLKPNDLVYVPTKEELLNKKVNLPISVQRIYKYVDINSKKGNFVPYSVSKVLFSMNFTKQKENNISCPIQDEFGVGSQCSKNYRAITGEMIKEICIPINVDRLGNIIGEIKM